MKKIILGLFVIVNLGFIVNFLIHFESPSNIVWPFFFVIGTVLSVIFMVRSPKNSTKFLSIAVLATSISSLGAFGFQYFLSNLMG